VSNDDGVLSAGVEALAAAMAPLGEVWVVAPEVQQSAASHAISLHRPLRIRKVRERWYSVDGTPTDCAYLAIHHLMKDELPAIAVAGINHGPNLADDVIYSGTVAAAMEASLLGVPAIAFSLVSKKAFDFGPAARFARALVAAALSDALPPRVLLNVNIPEGEPEGYAVTRLGRHSYANAVVENTDPRGRRYYWIGGNAYQHEDIPGSDCNAVLDARMVSVTPMRLDLTDEPLIKRLASWKLDGFVRRPGEAG
jgi:5'-nucleotidase